MMEAGIHESSHKSNPAIVAILAMHDELRPFRGNTQNFVDLIETGMRHGVNIYVVTPRDLILNKRQVLAYAYNKSTDTWIPQSIPRPTVIYNRVPYRKDENDPYVQEVIKQCMADPRIRFFNPAFFNKWQLFKWLGKSQKTKSYIPHTVRWAKTMRLLPLLAKSPLLYFKPESGKAGAGIMRVRRLNGHIHPYRLNIQSRKSSAELKFKTVKALKNKLHAIIGDELYIVQQGIRLPLYRNRPFDLRVLVQKNYRGVWSLTGIGARLAGLKSITTHVPRGGSIEAPEKLLSHIFGEQDKDRILKKVKLAAIKIAKQIEHCHQSTLGEMSMDIGVDIRGDIWFFEANAKPMKFDEPHIRKKSLENTVMYCKYLTKKSKGQRKKSDHDLPDAQA